MWEEIKDKIEPLAEKKVSEIVGEKIKLESPESPPSSNIEHGTEYGEAWALVPKKEEYRELKENHTNELYPYEGYVVFNVCKNPLSLRVDFETDEWGGEPSIKFFNRDLKKLKVMLGKSEITKEEIKKWFFEG